MPGAGPLFAELRRGLEPDYFETYDWTEEWTGRGRKSRMRFWIRLLRATTRAFTAAGFRVADIHQPQPVPAARELFPDDYRVLVVSPCFPFFVLRTD